MPTQKRARFVQMCIGSGMFWLVLGLMQGAAVAMLGLSLLSFLMIALPVGAREATILPEPVDPDGGVSHPGGRLDEPHQPMLAADGCCGWPRFGGACSMRRALWLRL